MTLNTMIPSITYYYHYLPLAQERRYVYLKAQALGTPRPHVWRHCVDVLTTGRVREKQNNSNSKNSSNDNNGKSNYSSRHNSSSTNNRNYIRRNNDQ